MTVSRREVLSGLAVMTAGPVLPVSAQPASSDAAAHMLEPGIINLNTDSLGPTPRSILDAVLNAWNDLEENPAMKTYGGTTHTLADKTRDLVGGLIGCAVGEVLLTRSTTNAMNIAALGIDLSCGDRVLTTDVEHEGGSAAGKHLEKRKGIGIDRIVIAPEDRDRL